MRNKELEELKKFIIDHEDLKSWTKIAEEFLKENPNCKVGLQPLSMIVYEQMTRVEDPSTPIEIELNQDGDDCEESYSVVDGNYTWKSRSAGTIKLSVKEVDDIFYEYSQFGLNMSQEEVRRKHKISLPQWGSLKSILKLYKASHIFSPYTADNTPQNELSEMMQKKLEMKSEDQNRLIEEESRKHTIKEYEKIIKKDKQDAFSSREFIDCFRSLMPKKEKIGILYTPEKECSSVEITAIIADLHIGAKTEGLLTTPNYNSAIVEARLDEVAVGINKKHAKQVTLCILGDLIESFTGLNHPNSWQNMEYGAYGAKVVFQAYNVLSNFFEKISNLKNVKIIGGNHDRSTSDNKVDRRCTTAQLIYHFLDEKYKGIYNIEYSDLMLTHDMGYTKLLLAHGDKKIIKKETIDSNVLQFGDQTKMNLIFTGHLHSRGLNLDRQGLRWYKTPSIFSGNYYSEENGWNARPGFFIVEEVNGGPIVTDYPLSLNYEYINE